MRQSAYAIVNEGRRLIGCDRVTLAVKDGGKLRVVAVSGLDTIDRRATEVRHLGKLAQAVAKTKEPLWHTAGSGEAAPQIDQHLQPYIDASHARLVAVLPLMALPACVSLPNSSVEVLKLAAVQALSVATVIVCAPA